MVETLRTGIPALHVEMSIERPDGSRLPVLMSFAALENAQGETTGAIASFLDITERRLLENSLVARAADLVRADRSKDEFLAMLAHELRNPLAPMRNAAEILRTADASPEAGGQAQRSMSMLQSLRGHTTRTAFSRPDAVAAAAEFVPEVVLLDIGLPGIDGYEVARRLRAMPALAGVFLVAVSGYGSEEDRARARAAGFDEYLVKPADLTLLRNWLPVRA